MLNPLLERRIHFWFRPWGQGEQVLAVGLTLTREAGWLPQGHPGKAASGLRTTSHLFFVPPFVRGAGFSATGWAA